LMDHMLRLVGNFQSDLQEVNGHAFEISAEQVVNDDAGSGGQKGMFTIMSSSKFESVMKQQAKSRDEAHLKASEERQSKNDAETKKFLESPESAKVRAAVTALSRGSTWGGVITLFPEKEPVADVEAPKFDDKEPKESRDAKLKAYDEQKKKSVEEIRKKQTREGKYELKITSRVGSVAHGTHFAYRPIPLGHNNAVEIQCVFVDTEHDAPAGTPAVVGPDGKSHIPKVVVTEVRVKWTDQETAFDGVFDATSGQVEGNIHPVTPPGVHAKTIGKFAIRKLGS